jgi:hypothetical protein
MQHAPLKLAGVILADHVVAVSSQLYNKSCRKEFQGQKWLLRTAHTQWLRKAVTHAASLIDSVSMHKGDALQLSVKFTMTRVSFL